MALAHLPPSLLEQIRESRDSSIKAQARTLPPAEKGAPQPFAPVAANLVDARISACDAFLRAVQAVVTILSNAGHALQNDIVDIHADSALQKSGDAMDPMIHQVSRGFLKTCHGLGGTLVDFTAKLSDEVVELLREVQRSVKEDKACKYEGLEALDQEEMQYYKLAKDCITRKEKATEELKRALDEHQAMLDGHDEAWAQTRACSKSESKITHAAGVQAGVVEELAPLMFNARLALESKEKGIEAFNELLCKLDAKCMSPLQTAVGHCSSVWGGAAHSLQTMAKKINNIASAAALTNTIQVQSSGFRRGEPMSRDAHGDSMAHADQPAQGKKLQFSPLTGGGPVAAGAPRKDAAAGAGAGAEVEGLLQDDALYHRGVQESSGCARSSGELAPTEEEEQERRAPPVAALEHHPADDLFEPRRPAPVESSPTAADAQPSSTPPGGSEAAPASSQLADHSAPSSAGEPMTTSTAGTAAAEPEMFVCTFDHEVLRLGFEVLWEAEAPSVGNVMPGGASDLRGVVSGDILVEINGTRTYQQGRDVLMPLLKERPLELKLNTKRRTSVTRVPEAQAAAS